MTELLYDVNSVWISLVLFVSMVLVIEAGYRIGTRAIDSRNSASKAHITAIQSSMLGILALLLGFTFSLSLQRFDHRSEAVMEEANVIGTTYHYAQLLPTSMQTQVLPLIRDYVNLRVEASGVSSVEFDQHEILREKVTRLQSALWECSQQAATMNINPVVAHLFIRSMDDLIGASGKHDAALNRHVPEIVLLLLFATFLMTGAIVGFACGVGGHHPSGVTYMMVALIVVLVFIILDLDRPRRGVIKVSQQSLITLQTSINTDLAHGKPLQDPEKTLQPTMPKPHTP